MGNHIHLIGEAMNAECLSRGLQGLETRIAKALNRVMKRRGRVFADRYHSRILRTPTEVRHAIRYVLQNAIKHKLIERGADPFSSVVAGATAAPRTWLLREARKRC